MTAGLPSTRAMKPSERGTTTSASIALKSETTTAPADVTAERISAGLVPWAKRTTVTSNGFPAAVAEPEIASAAANAARRRLGRFTVFLVSARGRRSYITRSRLLVRLSHLAVIEGFVERLLVDAGLARDLAQRAAGARRFLDDLGRLVVADVRVERRRGRQ